MIFNLSVFISVAYTFSFWFLTQVGFKDECGFVTMTRRAATQGFDSSNAVIQTLPKQKLLMRISGLCIATLLSCQVHKTLLAMAFLSAFSIPAFINYAYIFLNKHSHTDKKKKINCTTFQSNGKLRGSAIWHCHEQQDELQMSATQENALKKYLRMCTLHCSNVINCRTKTFTFLLVEVCQILLCTSCIAVST